MSEKLIQAAVKTIMKINKWSNPSAHLNKLIHSLKILEKACVITQIKAVF